MVEVVAAGWSPRAADGGRGPPPVHPYSSLRKKKKKERKSQRTASRGGMGVAIGGREDDELPNSARRNKHVSGAFA